MNNNKKYPNANLRFPAIAGADSLDNKLHKIAVNILWQ
jgi:hypothetical protein